ncbi:mevalonate kinase [Paraliobacillus quinghaiensis]|uniref:mevalonate kinase n=1 Tax=Paraliobacillus quinghaiensis TaxID=470815 RepID=A0A917WXW7_9BACI|nr:mevalonate kinase [Paraliobacillus quinghaiensis]GGM38886.1 mevalonate kinase [Paraliobacillus quinghaiensis]
MLELPQKTAIGSAHSKLILVGEHAVVYGEPAIALPFPEIQVKAMIDPVHGPIRIDSSFYTGPLSSMPEKLQGIAVCIKKTCKKIDHDASGFRIQITSTIPIGRGLGSSAAIAIAIVRSLYAYFEEELERDDLMELVDIAETHAHGSPSGIDMAAASSEVPIWFEKDKEIDYVQISAPLHLVVADTGRIGDTHAAVASIKEKYKVEYTETKQSITHLGELTGHAREALQKGDHSLLGSIMNRAQDELVKLGVSDESIDRLTKVAQKSGALGAKLTGGGRGGCIIALAKSIKHAKEIADALLVGGADQTWYFTVGE